MNIFNYAKTLMGIAITATVIAILGLIFTAPRVTIDIPETQVRHEIAARLPITIERSGANIVVRAAQVDFLSTNQINISAETDVAGYGFSGIATTQVTSSLRYEYGSFYLSDLGIDDVQITLDDTSDAKVSDYKSAASGLFATLREKIEDEKKGSGEALDRIVSDTADRIKPKIAYAVDDALKSIPIYSLHNKDMKHNIAALALEDVFFTEDAAHATLNIGRLVLNLVIFGFVGLFWILASVGIVIGGPVRR